MGSISSSHDLHLLAVDNKVGGGKGTPVGRDQRWYISCGVCVSCRRTPFCSS